MAHADTVTWVCDSCGKKTDCPPKGFPSGWRQVTSISVDGNEKAPQQKWEICGSCGSNVERLLMDRNNVPVTSTAPEAA